MNFLVLLMILVVTTFEYLVSVGLLPRVVKYLPEILSGIVLLYVVALGARNRFQYVRPAYWLAFGVVMIVIVCGVVANEVEPGPLFAGIRSYLRAVPWFFLPMVYVFSERQIKSQLQLLLLICILQLPIAWSQRSATIATGGATGDLTAGTLTASGLLSVFLICAACMWAAMFLRKRISAWVFVPLFILLLLPTTINETKVTVFMLPIGLLVTFVAGSERGTRLKNAVVASSLLAVFAAIFIPIYDYYISHREYGTPITEFFTKEGRFERYMSRQPGKGEEKAGRLEAFVRPLQNVVREPVSLTFGYGIGNASDSALGDQFIGKYFDRYEPYLLTSMTVYMLEIGFLGLVLVFLVYALIYRDSRVVSDTDETFTSALAVGWTGVVAVMVLATFYTKIGASSALSYLFWYFSGLVAAHRVRAYYDAHPVSGGIRQ